MERFFSGRFGRFPQSESGTFFSGLFAAVCQSAICGKSMADIVAGMDILRNRNVVADSGRFGESFFRREIFEKSELFSPYEFRVQPFVHFPGMWPFAGKGMRKTDSIHERGDFLPT